jgi:GTPase Era involved in 16S rRNA processing
MSTQAADAWLILNDADAVETKMLATINRVLDARSNQEMFMSQLSNTSAFHNAVMNAGMSASLNGAMAHSINEIIRRTLESAEIMFHEDFRTYGPPRISVRFQSPQGATFVIQPKVKR